MDEVVEGSIIGFAGGDAVSVAINLGTWGIPFWSVAHCGIVANYQQQPYLFHSEVRNPAPCAIRKQSALGTRADYLAYILQQRGVVWHYKLRRPADLSSLASFLVNELGRPYDVIGAITTGQLHTENLDAIFCSEWVAAALRQVHLFPVDDAGAWNPNDLLRTLVKMGIYYKPIRLK